MKIKIFDRYIFRRVLTATLVCILLFVIVWIAPETLLKIIRRTLQGSYTFDVAIQLLFFEIPKILNKALPVGILLGSLYTFDKLSKDFELTVLRSVGLSFWRILAPVIVLGSIMTILCFVVSDKLSPYSCKKIMALTKENPSSHFIYITKDEQERPKQILIVPSYSKFEGAVAPVIMNFSEQHYSDASLLREIIVAENAQINTDSWIVRGGKKYLMSDEGVFAKIVPVSNLNILTKEKANRVYQLMDFRLKRDRDLTNSEISSYIKLLKEEKISDEYNDSLNKLLQRYFHALMCLLFAVLGCILGFSQPREQRLVGFTIAVGLVFLYYITLPFVDMLAEKGILSPYITSTIHPVIVLAAILFFKKMKGLR